MALNSDTNDTIDQLNQEAWENRIKDTVRSLTLSQEAVAEARKINYDKGVANGLKTFAFCQIRLSKYKEAEVTLKEAEQLFMAMNDKAGQTVVLEYYGIIQRYLGNLGGSLEFLLKALTLGMETGFIEAELTNLYQLGVTYRQLGQYEKALEYLFKCYELSQTPDYSLMEGYALNVIGSIYFETGDYEKALGYYEKGLQRRQQYGDKWGEAGSLDNIGATHIKLGNWQKAINYCEESLSINRRSGDKKGQSNALIHLAEIAMKTGDTEIAKDYSQESLEIRQASGDKQGEAEIQLFLAEMLSESGSAESETEVFDCLSRALRIGEETMAMDLLSKAHLSFYKNFKKKGDTASALKHLELHFEQERELHKDAIQQKILNLEISHKAEESKKEAELLNLRNVELAGLYENLKATQAQLIQSEKMASLGELTAGIAHEIQNPLNFVNNFSEINMELLGEMREELENGNMDEATSLAQDIRENEEKISHHGKRADAIVKAMLQHSRSSGGQPIPTDLNGLIEEYLRLSYHGLRAKERSLSTEETGLNITTETKLEEGLDLVKLVPQDMGRVLLNIFNNAFYAVTEKSRHTRDFHGIVKVSTKKEKEQVLIIIENNGPGISEAILEKIFQPFFTTKPSGQGTGLGLSLSYDIIKALGGDISVISSDKEGTRFTISLPLKS